MGIQSWKRWIAGYPICLAAVLAMGLILPHGVWAQKQKIFEETPGVCPQPRKTVTAPKEFLKLKNPPRSDSAKYSGRENPVSGRL